MAKIETNVIKPNSKFEYNNNQYLLIDADVETSLDTKILEVTKYINETSGKGKSESEQDELYKNAQKLYKDFFDELESVKYNFYLNKDQHNFLNDLVVNKLDYDVNTVFFAIELKNLFEEMKNSKFTNSELVCQKVNTTEITYIYHLISKHTVKGLTKQSFLFAEILMKIGEISKLFNYYETASKNLSADIQDWVVTFEEGVTREIRNTDTIEAQVLPNS